MFTPTQSRILKLLSDGKPHRRVEIHACLEDELAAIEAIKFHIMNIRIVLRRMGQDIVCELIGRSIHYRQVRLLNNND